MTDEVIALERQFPAWQVWTVRTWDGTRQGIVWCARRWDNERRLLHAHSAEELAEYLADAS